MHLKFHQRAQQLYWKWDWWDYVPFVSNAIAAYRDQQKTKSEE